LTKEVGKITGKRQKTKTKTKTKDKETNNGEKDSQTSKTTPDER
jgi:hypothetical protein